ncbi:MAG: hypothetical protein ACI39E_07425 [Acutalibacteraceae bacterium]
MKHKVFSFRRRCLPLLLCAALLCGGFSGCSVTVYTARETAIPLSGFEDVSGQSGKCIYEMQAEFSDSYTFSCTQATSLRITAADGTELASGEDSAVASLTEGERCRIEVTTAQAEQKFLLNVQADSRVRRLPYDNVFTIDPDDGSRTVSDPDTDPLTPAKIHYQKREGGTYVYANNPEILNNADVGQALLRDEGLKGDVEFTYEHSNQSSGPVYLGYQLKNEGERDVFVTVTNIGMQVSGEWLGQQSWSDYYNYKFELPEDYFINGRENELYRGQDFIDYTPRVFQPTTYRIPAGQYIYVLGGTSKDAYNATNVAGTADQMLLRGKCSNGVVKCKVTGGSVTGTFYCYNDVSQVQAEPAEQGYVVMRDDTLYGLQYKGRDDHQGLIESNMCWTVNDKTPSGRLPVTYQTSYDELATRKGRAYQEYNNREHTRTDTYWVTNINPQNAHDGVGTDMMTFACETTDGEPIVIDNDHADGYGTMANLGNWMVDYHDNYTFINDGDTPRTFTIQKRATGALMAMVLDRDGNVLATKCTIQQIDGTKTEYNTKLYTLEVAPHSVEQITVSFLLMGNSGGYVYHFIELD